MKKLLVISISLFLFACNDSDYEGDNQSVFSETTWALTKEEGYEISADQRQEWSEKPADFDATYVFRKDNAGEYITCEGEIRSTSPIKWEYDATAKTLTIDFIENGDVTIYNVESMSSSKMVLVIHKIETEYSYEYYNKETYTKK